LDRAAYGKKVVSALSGQLTERYGEGYSATNLWLFRQFHITYLDREDQILYPAGRELKSDPTQPKSISLSEQSHPSEILYPLGRESAAPAFHPSLSWSHYRAIMRVEKPQARAFYESESVAAGWTKRELERQIHSLYFERLLLSKDKQGMIQEQRAAAARPDPISILKSSAVLEFLGLPDSPCLHESRLEQAIMDNLQAFLLELGRGFSFVARQKRLLYETDEFYVDLVFYNYLLKCFVLIDLKIGKLTHQDVGQMDSHPSRRAPQDREAHQEHLPQAGPSPRRREAGPQMLDGTQLTYGNQNRPLPEKGNPQDTPRRRVVVRHHRCHRRAHGFGESIRLPQEDACP